jgi:hypothetical protein
VKILLRGRTALIPIVKAFDVVVALVGCETVISGAK